MRSIASLMRLLVASLVLVVPAITGYAADQHAQAPAGSPPAQAEAGRLTELQARWSRAQESAQASQAPVPVLQQIADLLAGIAAAQAQLQAQLTVALDLQSRVAQEAARCSAILAQIGHAQEQAMGGLLVLDSLPIWSAEGWSEARAVLRGRIRDAVVSRWDALVRYGREPSQGWPLHLGSFLVLMGVFRAARRRVPQWTATGQAVSSATAALGRPYSAALIVPLLLASTPISPVPPTLRQLFPRGRGPRIRHQSFWPGSEPVFRG